MKRIDKKDRWHLIVVALIITGVCVASFIAALVLQIIEWIK